MCGHPYRRFFPASVESLGGRPPRQPDATMTINDDGLGSGAGTGILPMMP
jgi:hypothetical protein